MNHQLRFSSLSELRVDQVVPDPDQPRKLFAEDDISEMAASLRVQGQISAIIVMLVDGKHVIVDGERRWRAAKKLRQETILGIVVETRPSRAELTLIQLIANCQRVGLNAVDLSESYAQVMNETGMSMTELATAISKSKSHVSEHLAIGRLSDDIKSDIRAGKISFSKAAALARLPPDEQAANAAQVASGSLSRDELQRKAAKSRRAAKPKGKGLKRITFELPALSASLAARKKLSLDDVLDAMQSLVTECKRARTQGLDISTLVSLIRDRTRANGNLKTKETPHV